ncbi:hypothetical protein [Kineococcus sp. G2]|uniref:hypothetical protein n=1 Tax=Kineococcus sp. G2 TaxID=3127484 RepID=UPI00301C4D36
MVHRQVGTGLDQGLHLLVAAGRHRVRQVPAVRGEGAGDDDPVPGGQVLVQALHGDGDAPATVGSGVLGGEVAHQRLEAVPAKESVASSVSSRSKTAQGFGGTWWA